MMDGWMDHAACRELDTDLFFPDHGELPVEVHAICAGCSVSRDCLGYALRHRIAHGIWGGVSVRDRRRMLRNAA